MGIRKADKDIFESLKKGEKSIETRACTRKFQKIKEGDTLVFNCDNQKLEKKVKKVEHFESIEELFESVDIKNVFPDIDTLETLKQAYFSFPNYKQKIDNYGLFAFWLGNSN